ncbi:IS4 family transposase [Aquibacillus halophilus]|nr:IS4 family transposase [Aquibacillus halophilus]
MRKTFLGAVEVSERLLNDVIFMCESRVKPTYFTRKGNKLDFKSTILFSLYFVKKTIQLELDSFFKMVNPTGVSITKQGYSEARRKVSPTAFRKLSHAVVQWFYDDDSFKTFHGYRLCAIDGSIVELPNTEGLRNHFGYVQNQMSPTNARARVAAIYDIENDIILTSRIAPYKSSERDAAKEMIKELKELGFKNDLLLFDRGYPSRDFIAYVEEYGIKYLMRASIGAMKEIREAVEPDQIIHFTVNGKELSARVLRVLLPSNEEEILVTNVMEKHLGVLEFKDLYFKRWGIEVKYDELKNKLQMENFTGSSQVVIEQDFYASIYLINMVALVKNEANKVINEKDKKKNLKHHYQINTNILIGKLKESMIILLLEERAAVRQKIFNKVMKEIIKNKTPIRPGRKYPRNKNLKSNKFVPSRKRCL